MVSGMTSQVDNGGNGAQTTPLLSLQSIYEDPNNCYVNIIFVSDVVPLKAVYIVVEPVEGSEIIIGDMRAGLTTNLSPSVPEGNVQFNAFDGSVLSAGDSLVLSHDTTPHYWAGATVSFYYIPTGGLMGMKTLD